jgi:cytochrome P450
MLTYYRAISFDERVYKNPMSFEPSRYLPKPEGREEPFFESAFGYGRR